MALDRSFVEFVIEQINAAGDISCKNMFGGCAIYCDGKVVALICDNRLFIKPTQKGKKFIGESQEAPPYPGAKPHFLIEDKIEDKEWISGLVRITAKELPKPKAKKKSK